MRLQRIANIAAGVVLVAATARLLSQPVGRDNPAAASLLERRVGAVQCNRISFDGAVSMLAEAAGVEIDVDASGWEKIVGHRISLLLRADSLENDLDVLLHEASADVEWYPRGQKIVIADVQRVPRALAVYDVRDIIRKMIDQLPPDYDPAAPVRPPHGVIDDGFRYSPPAGVGRKQLVVIMQEWKLARYCELEDGVAQVSDGRLLIVATPTGHRTVKRRLALLRAIGVSTMPSARDY